MSALDTILRRAEPLGTLGGAAAGVGLSQLFDAPSKLVYETLPQAMGYEGFKGRGAELINYMTGMGTYLNRMGDAWKHGSLGEFLPPKSLYERLAPDDEPNAELGGPVANAIGLRREDGMPSLNEYERGNQNPIIQAMGMFIDDPLSMGVGALAGRTAGRSLTNTAAKVEAMKAAELAALQKPARKFAALQSASEMARPYAENAAEIAGRMRQGLLEADSPMGFSPNNPMNPFVQYSPFVQENTPDILRSRPIPRAELDMTVPRSERPMRRLEITPKAQTMMETGSPRQPYMRATDELLGKLDEAGLGSMGTSPAGSGLHMLTENNPLGMKISGGRAGVNPLYPDSFPSALSIDENAVRRFADAPIPSDTFDGRLQMLLAKMDPSLSDVSRVPSQTAYSNLTQAAEAARDAAERMAKYQVEGSRGQLGPIERLLYDYSGSTPGRVPDLRNAIDARRWNEWGGDNFPGVEEAWRLAQAGRVPVRQPRIDPTQAARTLADWVPGVATDPNIDAELANYMEMLNRSGIRQNSRPRQLPPGTTGWGG